MGSSFTVHRGHGFWARDRILETWLAALADASRWLAVAARPLARAGRSRIHRLRQHRTRRVTRLAGPG
jgi:hypothetical protein